MSRTFIKDHAGRPAWRVRLLGALLALVLVPAALSAQAMDDKYRENRDRNSRFNLNASATTVLRVNQYQCGLANNGDTCTDVFNSPTGGGGFWPTGSPNQYMFRAGLQITGIIPLAADCANKNTGSSVGCFPWAGDTTGAFMVSQSGTTKHGTPLSDIYDSLNPDDADIWPCVERNGIVCDGTPDVFPDFPFVSAMVEDTSLFNEVLIGRKAASQQDTWVMYWDGDPARTGGRTHPMGMLVEQRTMAWNYPAGNESVVYFIYKITNVTDNALFQRMNEERYFGGANRLPNSGWRMDSIYVTYVADPDVTARYQLNYATASFPFNLGYSYDGSFFAPEFEYSPALHPAPFFPNAPGLVGVKYLKSPIDPQTGEEVGLTAFSLTTNGAPFADPANVQRGWRFHSLNVDPGKGDPNCTFPLTEVKERRSCYLAQVTADVRWFQASGPFSLEPGESVTIAVAQYVAPTVATPLISRGTNERNPPGLPTLAPGCNGEPIRPIDIASGYVRPLVCPEPGEMIDQFDVQVVRGSLLGRALVAQSIFDNKFLLGFAPETPPFFLVPGSNRITVVWEPSVTERTGDPFFSAAGDPTNPLYDPNYRQFDVEGYRIYRGTSPSNMRLIAQFDKAGTTFRDVLCVSNDTHVTGEPCTEVNEVPISHPFVQYTTIARLASGDAIVLAADTALSEQTEAGTSLNLTDTGIPYTFVDTDVRNGFQYFYRVTAFDINSVRSGPSSLESAGGFKSTIPQAPSTSLANADYTFTLLGRDNTPLSTTQPTIDPATGRFSGPAAATTQLMADDLVAFAAQLLPTGSTEVIRIDSVVPTYYLSQPLSVNMIYFTLAGQSYVHRSLVNLQAAGNQVNVWYGLPGGALGSDPAARQALRAQGVDAPPLSGVLQSRVGLDRPVWNSAQANWAYKQQGFWNNPPPLSQDAVGGSRWFVGDNESVAEPTLGLLRHGELPGITTIFKPVPYFQSLGTVREGVNLANYQRGPGCSATGAACGEAIFRRFWTHMIGIHRGADFKLYWGAAGLDSVVDVTHNVRVEYSPALRSTFGFLTDSDGDGVLTYGDWYWVPGAFEETGTEMFRFSAQSPQPLARQPVVMPIAATGLLTATGNGFGLFINGEPFMFQGAVPTNTVWTLRTYNGSVEKNAAGQYTFTPVGGVPAVPGLRLAVTVNTPAQIVASQADLRRVHTVPDPYYAVSQFDLGPTTKELQFVNLPARATIRIFSLSGVLVDVINHDSPEGLGVAKWDLRNRSNQFVASGVYMFHVSTPDGKSHTGKFTVINSGIAR